jgi:hypothetical protein
MLHELAHVWVAQHVDARTRDAFLDAVVTLAPGAVAVSLAAPVLRRTPVR